MPEKLTREQSRLEELRAVLRSESMSYAELAELQSLAPYIDPSDVELLEAAGVPEIAALPDGYLVGFTREQAWHLAAQLMHSENVDQTPRLGSISHASMDAIKAAIASCQNTPDTSFRMLYESGHYLVVLSTDSFTEVVMVIRKGEPEDVEVVEI